MALSKKASYFLIEVFIMFYYYLQHTVPTQVPGL